MMRGMATPTQCPPHRWGGWHQYKSRQRSIHTCTVCGRWEIKRSDAVRAERRRIQATKPVFVNGVGTVRLTYRQTCHVCGTRMPAGLLAVLDTKALVYRHPTCIKVLTTN